MKKIVGMCINKAWSNYKYKSGFYLHIYLFNIVCVSAVQLKTTFKCFICTPTDGSAFISIIILYAVNEPVLCKSKKSIFMIDSATLTISIIRNVIFLFYY